MDWLTPERLGAIVALLLIGTLVWIWLPTVKLRYEHRRDLTEDPAPQPTRPPKDALGEAIHEIVEPTGPQPPWPRFVEKIDMTDRQPQAKKWDRQEGRWVL